MIDTSLMQQVVERVTEQAGQTTLPTPSQADGGDIQRFQEAIAGGAQPSQTVAGVDGLASSGINEVNKLNALEPNAMPPSTAVEFPASPAPTLGDTILQGFEKMRASQQTSIANINDIAARGQTNPLSAQDMISMQMQMTSVMLEHDLVAKVVGKATQSLETLFKSQ